MMFEEAPIGAKFMFAEEDAHYEKISETDYVRLDFDQEQRTDGKWIVRTTATHVGSIRREAG